MAALALPPATTSIPFHPSPRPAVCASTSPVSTILPLDDANDQRASTSTIFDLPLFLREQIYDSIFNERVICIALWDFPRNRSPKGYRDRTVPCPTMAIAQTCRVFRAEALQRLYRTVVFRFQGRDRDMMRLMEMVRARARDADANSTGGGENGEETALVEERETRRKDSDNDNDNDNDSDNDSDSDSDDPRKIRELANKARLCEISKIVHHMHRVDITHYDLPALGWDFPTFTWTPTTRAILPHLQHLNVHFQIAACHCNVVPLITKFDPETGETLKNPRRPRRHPPPKVSDGAFMRKVARSAPRDFRIKFKVDLVEHCSAMCTTCFTLEPLTGADATAGTEETAFELLQWDNYFSCNYGLVRLLKDYGLRDKAKEMQRMIDDNVASKIGP